MSGRGKYFVKDHKPFQMETYSNYPQPLLDAMSVTRMVGPKGVLQEGDIRVTGFSLEPGAFYDDHVHPHPEIYIFLTGTAECQWGDEGFTAEPGTVTHCPPNLPHAMRVTSDEPLTAYIIGWAPGGDQEALNSPSVLLGGGRL
ncbi:MAG: hypothetical protein CMQ29_02225 [Gammaproteobacteria bacterium]|nr:hypothetical protein [Gammaproteobacteria bacterium]